MRTKAATLLLLTAILTAVPVFAGSSKALMNVSVTVVARTILTVDSQPASVDVTAADVARGYIDVAQPVTFEVRSNASGGYAVQFEPVGSPFPQATVTWDNSLVTVGAEGTWVTRPYSGTTATAAAMHVRLMVAPGTAPGTYAWPVAFAAESL